MVDSAPRSFKSARRLDSHSSFISLGSFTASGTRNQVPSMDIVMIVERSQAGGIAGGPNEDTTSSPPALALVTQSLGHSERLVAAPVGERPQPILPNKLDFDI